MPERAVEYRHNYPLDPVDVARVFDASGINRPTHDIPRIARMFSEPCLVVSAWVDGALVGVGRALTDYCYCCYLSDLAVDKQYQGMGIGRGLIHQIRQAIGEQVSLVLVSAPGAVSYYPTVGFESATDAFIIRRTR